MQALILAGRIVNGGRLGGQRADFDFDLPALRRISHVGVIFCTRSAEEVPAITGAMREDP